MRKAKAHLELSLARDNKENKKAFYKYISSKRNIKENFGLLLNQISVLVTEGREEVPNDWRKAKVTPTFKKGKEDPGNYCPVTFIPGKVMKQIILEVITKHVKEKVIMSSQHGFTKRIVFYDGMVDEGRAVNVVHLEFSKIFDAVCHNMFIGKLRKCELDEWAELSEWQSLEGRYNGVESSQRSIVGDFSQGSILGPVLLNLFINNMDKGIEWTLSKCAAVMKLGVVAHTPDGWSTSAGP
ncbi:hypothetical protein WISP_105613 [Willisornis vidua]|uniref:Reverse transcriptase domain-containing protein n=1 Tax=Willisornis vidua TaxID=1566151 RepID=A0ABQ9D1Q2_9PASS|nr:hypothetical protein WISP_105613 [Willisornis vidua]